MQSYSNEGRIAIQLTPQVKKPNARYLNLPLHLRELRISQFAFSHVLDCVKHLIVNLLLRNCVQVVMEVVCVEVEMVLRAVLLR